MSHRKFKAPRHGSLRFLPRKRCRRHRPRIRSFPRDDSKQQPHLTAFIGYKAGMTHVMRQLKKPGSKAHEKDIVEGVTIIETPPMNVVGLVGYVKTPAGLRSITTVWASHTDDSFKRRFYKNWTRSKRKAFTKWQAQWAGKQSGHEPAEVTRRLNYIRKYADVVRVIAHSQIKKLKNLGMKKAHVMEIQVNGGDTTAKVAFAYALFEKQISVKDLFAQNELIDTIAVTKGHGWKGVVNRWGVTRLPRKTHRGNRKVACIGSWHPARVAYSIARAGQKGYHHRTELHKKIYRIGDKIEYGEDKKPTTFSATTEQDLTQKNITPMGGFVNYGEVKQDFIMIKGTCPGPRKRPIALRKAIVLPSGSGAEEEIELKFIDTSSQMGNGRFQTSQEMRDWYGPKKADKLKEKARKARERAARLKKRREQGLSAIDEGEEEEKAKEAAAAAAAAKKGKKKKGKGSKKKGKGSGKKGKKGGKEKTQRKGKGQADGKGKGKGKAAPAKGKAKAKSGGAAAAKKKGGGGAAAAGGKGKGGKGKGKGKGKGGKK